MTNEFSALISELKEQILYLQELGVENFSVELPEISFSSKFEVRSPKSKIPVKKLERFIPTEEILKKTVESAPKISSVSTEKSRRNLLESTKLSRLPTLPKRNLFYDGQTTERVREEEMTKNKPEEMPSLFGEIKQELPESNETIEEIRADIGNCTRCPLWEGRTQIVHRANRSSDVRDSF